MSEMNTWESETLALLNDAQIEAVRLEQRLALLTQQAEAAKQRVDAIQATLDLYRAKHGRPTAQEPELRRVAAEYETLNPKQMVQKWADEHDGVIVMTEMTSTLAAAGIFTDKRSADGVLYPVVRRGTLYEKVQRGVYRKRAAVRLVEAAPQAADPLPPPRPAVFRTAASDDEDDEDALPFEGDAEHPFVLEPVGWAVSR